MMRLLCTTFLGIGILYSGLVNGQTTVNLTTSNSFIQDVKVGNEGDDEVNFSGEHEMAVYYDSAAVNTTFRSFISFDLSNIPANALIISATLTLHPKEIDNAEDHPIYIERVNSEGSWTATTLTWNNQPDVKPDRLAFSHAVTSALSPHAFDVEDHVQYMVNNQPVNNGWCIRLQNEEGTNSHGVIYHSSEASNVSDRPQLSIEYMLPVTCLTEVTHNSAGNTDASVIATVSGGTTLKSFAVYKDEEVVGSPGTLTKTLIARRFSDGTTTPGSTFDAGTQVITVENLEPGSYYILLTDQQRYETGDTKFSAYQRFLVGRHGEVTECLIGPGYVDNVTIQADKPTAASPIDRNNTNYAGEHNILRIATYPDRYEFASLTRYRCDFDDQLEYSQAELKIDAYYRFVRHATSSNAVKYNVLTSDWLQPFVTWNTRPTSDTSITVFVPKTTNIGQSHPARSEIDTVSILDLVRYWQNHPTSTGNYGFEMVLANYDQSAYAQRTYASSRTGKNYLRLAFTVKDAILSTFDDVSNTGTIEVNAPVGDLPYSYLISHAPIGSLQSIWDEIKDATIIDSAAFFQGNVNDRNHTFNNLSPGEYHIAVFDNSGIKIQEGSALVNTTVEFANSTGVTISSDRLIEREAGASGIAYGRLYGEMLKDNAWGGFEFEVTELGDVLVGFNKTPNTTATALSDFDFGLKIASNGDYRIIRNGAEEAVLGKVAVGSIVSLEKQFGAYVGNVDDTEIYRSSFTESEKADLFGDVVLLGTAGAVRVKKYKGKFQKIGLSNRITYPECGQFTGDLVVGLGFFVSPGPDNSSTLINNDSSGPSFEGELIAGEFVFSNIPIGSYTLSTTYATSLLPGSATYTKTEQVAIGYVVEWENLHLNNVSPLNTIQQNLFIPAGTSGTTANSTNKTVVGYPNWVQFETQFPSHVVALSSSDNRKEKFKLTDESGINALTVQSAIGDENYVSGSTSQIMSPDFFDGVWRIDQHGSSYKLYRNGSLTKEGNLYPSAEEPYHITIEQVGNPRYVRTIASFCKDLIVEQYIQPKRAIEGGYFLVPPDDLLRFEFTEEYVPDTDSPESDDLSYIVRDYTGTDYTASLGTLDEIFGDNRFELDVSSLTAGYYVMEIKNQKGEDWFIRFKVQ